MTLFNRISCFNFCWIFFFILLQNTSFAQFKILNNGYFRGGNGYENSINTVGNLQQPYYYNTNSASWRQLTYSSYPLDIRWGVGGDGTNNWNINGILIDNPTMYNVSFDYSNFTITNVVTGDGYGSIKFTGNTFINSQLFQVQNTYTITQTDGFVQVKVKITNLSGAVAHNVRVWIGTKDDWVGMTDNPIKTRGNLIGGVFTPITVASTQAKAIKIYSNAEAVIMYSSHQNSNSSISTCCNFYHATNQNPATSIITSPAQDGSYALYTRFNDILPGASDEIRWYYAGAELQAIDSIIEELSNIENAIPPEPLNCQTALTTTAGNAVTSTVTGGSGGTITWTISPSTGVSSVSGNGSSTGPITFSNVGTYTVTFTSTGVANPSGTSPAPTTTCSRTIQVGCSVGDAIPIIHEN